jgi:hypothetical protein
VKSLAYEQRRTDSKARRSSAHFCLEETTMTQWEYMTTDFKYYAVEEFNRLGKEGWEMCGYAFDPGYGSGHQVFKRPRTKSSSDQ